MRYVAWRWTGHRGTQSAEHLRVCVRVCVSRSNRRWTLIRQSKE